MDIKDREKVAQQYSGMYVRGVFIGLAGGIFLLIVSGSKLSNTLMILIGICLLLFGFLMIGTSVKKMRQAQEIWKEEDAYNRAQEYEQQRSEEEERIMIGQTRDKTA